MRHIKVLVVVAALVLPPGCGGSAPATDSVVPQAPAVVLHEINERPGCFNDIDSTLIAAPYSGLDLQQILLLEMRFAFGLQYAQLIARPVLADPTALSWRIEGERSLIEGDTVTRGETWGWLSFGVTTWADGLPEQRHLGVEVRYSPAETLFELDDMALIYGDGFAAVDEVYRGCDPDSGVSFEIVPWMFNVVPGGVVPLADRAMLCWRDPAIVDPPIERTAWSCQQAVNAVLRDRAPQEVFTAAPVFLY